MVVSAHPKQLLEVTPNPHRFIALIRLIMVVIVMVVVVVVEVVVVVVVVVIVENTKLTL